MIRELADTDHVACRALWVELTEHHRDLYADPTVGGADPGGGFDDYLADPTRRCSWVAVVEGVVAGLTGLLDRGQCAEIEPIVVTASRRGRGLGRELLTHVVGEARRRGFDYVSIRPVARNVEAIRRFHEAGFQTLGGHVDLTMDLTTRSHAWLEGANLHGLEFRY
jgi:GNAT superfamily N-acetyltransferase